MVGIDNRGDYTVYARETHNESPIRWLMLTLVLQASKYINYDAALKWVV